MYYHQSPKPNLHAVLVSPVGIAAAFTMLIPAAVIYIQPLDNLTNKLTHAVQMSSLIWLYALIGVAAFALAFNIADPTYFRRRIFCLSTHKETRARGVGVWILTAVALSLLAAGILLASVTSAYLSRTTFLYATGTADAALKTSAEGSFGGHLPGVIKMFGYLTSTAVVLWLAVGLKHRALLNTRRYVSVLLILCAAVACKSLLAMTRIELFCCLALAAYVYLITWRTPHARVSRSIWPILVLGGVFIGGLVVATAVTTARGVHAESKNGFLTYTDLGVANAWLSLQTTTNHTYGFSTFLFSARYMQQIGLWPRDWIIPEADSQWIWNPAPNLLGSSATDFGYAGGLIYLCYGLFLGFCSRKCFRTRTSVTSYYLYLGAIWGLCSIWMVPLIRAPDYWASYLGGAILIRGVESVATGLHAREKDVRPRGDSRQRLGGKRSEVRMWA